MELHKLLHRRQQTRHNRQHWDSWIRSYPSAFFLATVSANLQTDYKLLHVRYKNNAIVSRHSHADQGREISFPDGEQPQVGVSEAHQTATER
jgi:hypothetical protein